MAPRNKVSLSPPSVMDVDLAPKALSRQEFARRLNRLMLARGMSQADLARAAFGTITDKNGREVARRRDSVSCYLRGKTWPDNQSVQELARALGVKSEELLPNTVMAAIDREEPALEIKQAAGHPDKVWLRVNRIVSLDTAVQIAQVLKEHDAKARAA